MNHRYRIHRISRAFFACVLAASIGGVPLSATRAQDTGGVAAPDDQKGVVVKGRAPVAQDILQVKLPRPKAFTLPNGVRVFVLEDHRLPLVNFSLSFPGGSLFEEKPGVADMTAAMMDEGTTSLSAQELATRIERIGANVGAGAGTERASVSAGGLSEYTDQIVALMTDVLLHPSFPADRLARVQFQTASRLAQQRAQPAFLAGELSAKIYYGDTPYAFVAPTPDQVRAITRADLQAFHDTYYRPNDAIIGIVGDVNPDEIVAQFRTALADWKPAEKTPERPAAAFQPQNTTRIYLIDRPGSAQTVLSFGNLAIDRRSPDYIPLVVANRILGGSSTGRLFQNLRESKGYTYGAYSRLSTPKWLGTWGASASVRTPVTAPAVGAFFDEFKRIQNEPVSADELEQAKRAIIGSFARTLERPSGVLAQTLELVENDLPLDYWDTYPAKVQAVTAGDVQRVAQKYLGENRIQLIAVGERSAIEAGLKPYGPLEIYDASGKPVAGTAAAPPAATP